MRLHLLATPVLLAAFASGFVGCAHSPQEADKAKTAVSEDTVAKAAAEKAISAAKAAIADSKQITNGWTTTDDLLEGAVAALARNEYTKVVDLANQAKIMAENAVAQAKSEKARLN